MLGFVPQTPLRYRGLPTDARKWRWGLGAGRQSIALAGWGSSVLISNQADMILINFSIFKMIK